MEPPGNAASNYIGKKFGLPSAYNRIYVFSLSPQYSEAMQMQFMLSINCLDLASVKYVTIML